MFAHFVKDTGSFLGSIIEAHTVIGADVGVFAFVDDRTFHQLFPPALVWAAQILRGELCDRALQEVGRNAGLRQGRRALFKKKKKKSNATHNTVYEAGTKDVINW